MSGSDKIPYNRRTFIKAFRDKVRDDKAKFTVLLCGVPSGRSNLNHWKKAISSALRIFKRRYGFEYILLFEQSPKGYEHAHIILTNRTEEDEYERVYKDDVNILRDLFFQKLSKSKGGWKELAKKININNPERCLHFSPSFMYKEKRIPTGHGPGFLNYLLRKREILTATTISSGLLKLRKTQQPTVI